MQTRTGIRSGWKDIANYLGMGVRTVQRYERELALPIHRPSGKSRGSVIATESELDRWVAASASRKMIARQPNLDPRVALKEFRRNITVLGRLRKQTAASRQALAQSRHALEETVESIAANSKTRERQAS